MERYAFEGTSQLDTVNNMSSHRTTRATSRYESKTTEPLFSDPPAAYTEDDADEGSKSSSDEGNQSSHTEKVDINVI